MEEEKKIIDSKIIDSKIIELKKLESKIEINNYKMLIIYNAAASLGIYYICSHLVEKYISPKLDLNIIEENLVVISSTIISRKIFLERNFFRKNFL